MKLLSSSINQYSISFPFETELLENGPADGYHLVLDITGIKMGHITRLNVSELKPSMFYLQEALPIRIVGLHFINAMSFMDKVMTLLRPFIKNELAKKLHLHESIKGLHSIAPPSYFPNDYEGGKEESFSALSGKFNL